MELDIFNKFHRDLDELHSFGKFIFEERMEYNESKPAFNVKIKSKRKFNPLLDMNDNVFKVKYRFTKDNMRKIIEMLRDDLDTENSDIPTRTNQVPVELQIMAAIRCWGHTEHPDLTASAHGVSERTMEKICRRVASCLSTKASRYIRMPATLAEKQQVTTAFQELGRMPQVIGAVGHHYVYLNRNCDEKTLNSSKTVLAIQVVADASLRIRDLDCKEHFLYEKDFPTKMFLQSRIKERMEQNEFRGRILIGGHQLPCNSYLFTSILRPNSLAEENFNRSHLFTYVSVTNCIQLWRNRFGMLGIGLNASISTARHTIVALAVLHNLAIEWNDRDLEYQTSRPYNGYYITEKETPDRLTMPRQPHDTMARVDFIKNHF